MKTVNNIFVGFLAAALVFGVSSCAKQDYPDRFVLADGVPTVHFVRYANSDEYIEQAYMDEVVCLVGDNLCSVAEVWFNDIKAVLNTSYITDHTLLVSTPKTQATVQTDLIYLVNAAKDTVKVPFKVLPPAPEVKSMSCEYAPSGSIAKIFGNYFIDVEYVEFQGVDARIDAADLQYTAGEITLTVPDGAAPGQVKVKTASGLSGSTFHYMDNRGMLFNFDGGLTVNGWNAATVISNPEDGISGNYIQFGDGDGGSHSLAGDGSTWSEGAGGYSMPYWPGSWNNPENYSDAPRLFDLVDFTNYSNMGVKFEMKIAPGNPWKSNAMQILFAPVTAVSLGNACTDIYGVEVAGQNNTYFHELDLPRGLYKPWEATGSFDTADEWITVTVPFSEFKYGWDCAASGGKLEVDSFASLLIFFHGGAGADCNPVIKVDNIRAVPIK